jgi:hypothetical protein
MMVVCRSLNSCNFIVWVWQTNTPKAGGAAYQRDGYIVLHKGAVAHIAYLTPFDISSCSAVWSCAGRKAIASCRAKRDCAEAFRISQGMDSL